MLIALWRHLPKRRHRQFYALLLLMIVSSVAEVVSIGLVLPFLGVLTSPDKVYQHPEIQPVIQALGVVEPGQLIFPMVVLFILAALMAGIVRLLLLYVMTRMSFTTGAELSAKIYQKVLYQEYENHISRNSSEIINSVTSKANTVVGSVINPVVKLISSSVLIFAVVLTLLAIDGVSASIAFFGFGVIYLVIIKFTKHKLKQNSFCISQQSTQAIKAVQEGLGGIRDVLIDGSQTFYCQLYKKANFPLKKALGDNVFINGSPRYIVETVGMILIALLAYSISLSEEGISSAIPILGALTLGAQRLLPALQQSFSAYGSIRGAYSSLEDILDLLNSPISKHLENSIVTPLPFKREVKLEELEFCHKGSTSHILKNINLELKKGECVGFSGPTGSGKSTLIDVIMGLLPPTSGSISVDSQIITESNKRSWQMHIAHVPQSIYLADGTIEENIAFGVNKEKIDSHRVKLAAERAQISNVIEQWDRGYQTIVGERGIRISGGQRQRIGIARALYKQADILVLDEATSALDAETEYRVMKSIKEIEGVTILIIAHRLVTLKECDKIVKLESDHSLHVVRIKK